MKINKLIFIGLFLLTILSLGAVNAEDNNLTVVDSEVNIDEHVLAEDLTVTNESAISNTDFDMYFDYLPDEDEVECGENVEFLVQFYNRGVTGQIYLILDNVTHEFEVQGSTDNQVNFKISELGEHQLFIKYEGNRPTVEKDFNFNVSDFVINVYPENSQFLYGHKSNLIVETLPGMTGEIIITIGNKTFRLNNFYKDIYDYYIEIEPNSLKFGDNIKVVYVQGEKDVFWNKTFYYTADLTSEIIVPRYNWFYNVEQYITLDLPPEAQGKLTVTIDGSNETSASLINGSVSLPVSINSLGEHIISAKYEDELGFNISSGDVAVEVLPNIVYPKKVGIGESNISFIMPESISGDVEIYEEDWLSGFLLTFITSGKIVNGSVSIPVNLNEGDYILLMKYNLTNGQHFEDEILISALSINPQWNMEINIRNDILKEKEQVPFSIVNAHFNLKNNFTLKIDGNEYDYDFDGSFFKIDGSNLDYGEHKFELTFWGDEYFLKTNASGVFIVAPISVDVPEEMDLDVGDSISIILPNDATGKITVKANGKQIYAGNVKDDAFAVGNNLYLDVYLDDLKYGVSDIEVEYVGNYAKSFIKKGKVNATYELSVENVLRYGYGTLEIKLPSEIDSGISLVIDGVKVNVKVKEGELGLYRYADSLNNLTIGNHTAVISYNGDSKYPARSVEQIFKVEPQIWMAYKEYDGFNGVSLILPDDAKGNLTVYINNKFYASVNANGSSKISFENLTFGRYYFKAYYDGDDYVVGNLSSDYSINPDFIVPKKMIWKSNEVLSINLKGIDGVLSIFSEDYYKSSTLVDGKASISLSGLPLGNQELFVEFKHIDDNGIGETYSDWITVKVVNPLKVSDKSVLYSSGDNYQAKVTDINGKALKNAEVTFYINGKKFKTVKSDKNGYATVKITQTPNTYKIKTVYNKISITKKLTVKHIVKLNSVTVKKSSKKLTLVATLSKVNGKYLKNKNVIFKFKGKSYKAKTNSKGVAKATISKSVLSKLKVGKNVTYHATYLKDTVKKTVKIKK